MATASTLSRIGVEDAKAWIDPNICLFRINRFCADVLSLCSGSKDTPIGADHEHRRMNLGKTYAFLHVLTADVGVHGECEHAARGILRQAVQCASPDVRPWKYLGLGFARGAPSTQRCLHKLKPSQP